MAFLKLRGWAKVYTFLPPIPNLSPLIEAFAVEILALYGGIFKTALFGAILDCTTFAGLNTALYTYYGFHTFVVIANYSSIKDVKELCKSY